MEFVIQVRVVAPVLPTAHLGRTEVQGFSFAAREICLRTAEMPLVHAPLDHRVVLSDGNHVPVTQNVAAIDAEEAAVDALVPSLLNRAA